jgi:drug/metabolite transporter (DMT)-like permease
VFLQETNTFFVTAMTVVILRKKFTYWQVWSILLSFAGIYVTMLQRAQGVFRGLSLVDDAGLDCQDCYCAL